MLDYLYLAFLLVRKPHQPSLSSFGSGTHEVSCRRPGRRSHFLNTCVLLYSRSGFNSGCKLELCLKYFNMGPLIGISMTVVTLVDDVWTRVPDRVPGVGSVEIGNHREEEKGLWYKGRVHLYAKRERTKRVTRKEGGLRQEREESQTEGWSGLRRSTKETRTMIEQCSVFCLFCLIIDYNCSP